MLAASFLGAGIVAACSEDPPQLKPLPVDARAAVDALLLRCHGPLRGSLGSLMLEMRAGSADGPCTKIALGDDRLRVDHPDKAVDLLLRQGAWHCSSGTAPQRLDATGRRALEDMRTLLAAAYLLPLYGARTITRSGPTVLAVEAADGTTWRLEIDLDAQRPRSVSGPAGVVEFRSFLSTGVSELPTRVRLGALGEQHLRLVASDVLFEAFVFQDPTAEASAARKRSDASKLTVIDDRPVEPTVREIDSTMFLALVDPGDWPTRSQQIIAAGTVLGEQGQFGAGLPFLFEADGKRWIGLPFVPDETQGSPPFVPRPGQDARRRPRHSAVVVYRRAQPFDEARADAENRARAFAERRQLRPDGPLRVLPFFNWGDAAPTAEQLAHMAVQVELPVQEPPK